MAISSVDYCYVIALISVWSDDMAAAVPSANELRATPLSHWKPADTLWSLFKFLLNDCAQLLKHRRPSAIRALERIG